MKWSVICQIEVLQPERGVAALVDGTQVAVFRTFDDSLYAIANRDPIGNAQVMSRGIVGTRGATPTVASPLHKQVYDLRTGECLDQPGIRIPTYPVRCIDGRVEISIT
jgi:nitrite reductase (NADH) small subunit